MDMPGGGRAVGIALIIVAIAIIVVVQARRRKSRDRRESATAERAEERRAELAGEVAAAADAYAQAVGAASTGLDSVSELLAEISQNSLPGRVEAPPDLAAAELGAAARPFAWHRERAAPLLRRAAEWSSETSAAEVEDVRQEIESVVLNAEDLHENLIRVARILRNYTDVWQKSFAAAGETPCGFYDRLVTTTADAAETAANAAPQILRGARSLRDSYTRLARADA